MSEEQAATKLPVHEAVCAGWWKQTNERLSRIFSYIINTTPAHSASIPWA